MFKVTFSIVDDFCYVLVVMAVFELVAVSSRAQFVNLPKTHRKGIKLIDDLQPLVPNSYGYSSAKYTQITLERGSSAWFLVDYKIIDGYVKSKPHGGGYANDTLIVLNVVQKQTLVSNFLSDINVRVSH